MALLALTAFLFFCPDDIEGNVLQQHDIQQGIANGQEGKAFHEATGETTRWTNSLFGGMPNFQIAPSYPAGKAIGWIWNVYTLGLPSPANLLFAMMAGFFIMCLCFRFKWYNALFASIAWGFSSYFIIIIGAGHIWKFVTLAYIPPTIGGIALCYRGKYLPGAALAALFGALQLQSNHPQMSYYFLFVIFAMVVAWLCSAIREHRIRQWGMATACVIAAGILAVGANSASLYNSYEYSKETVRGRATDLTPPPGTETGGMSRSAITAWSYGIDETMSLLIPNVKGGATIKPVAGESSLLSLADTGKADELSLAPEELQFLSQFPQYFGNQPMTNGPVYVGAFVLLLAILALFMVNTPMKWALFAVSILAILLSWGHNFEAFTDFFIDNFPGYNKFRAVASILVIVEFTIPLLAIMAVRKMLETENYLQRFGMVFYTVFGLGAIVCFLGWVAPSMFGEPYSASEIQQLQQAGAFSNPQYYNILNAIRETRLSLVSTDSLRSLAFILLGALVIFLYLRGAVKNRAVFVCMLTAVMLIDLFSVGKRYVNSENFTRPALEDVTFNKTAADEAILKDTSNYRVYDVQGLYSARSSYFHKTIGGYHAAKLTRYNDLLDHQISKGNMGVINMLNTKYFLSGEQYERNPGALGNAWFVDTISYVADADSEMAALDSLDTATAAVADAKFRETLGNAIPKSLGDTIYETSYAPNALTYSVNSAKGGIAVFSEIYFPWGWTATVDGKETQIGRVNYTLRALRVPAGRHEIRFSFDPKSVRVTNNISIASVSVIYILCAISLLLLALPIIRKRKS
ncbi:YfhO family protein [Barnesiella sp. CU968]|uniref:YfhO family protein n=1 Tax=Barnesiella sp. CU968 TaxID=2780099 RepID=UPI001EF9E97D|nr:YfhO family protein [Barnesiella sp. CU968]